MSVLVLFVGTEPHRRLPRHPTTCSCGRMPPVEASSSGEANAWRAHVEAEAAASGVKPVGARDRWVQSRPVRCGTCGWQGRRDTPNVNYRGPAGPCPKCGAKVRGTGED